MSPSARALLFTDIIDSTKLSESLGDERAAALWAEHDRRARELLPACGGIEIDRTDGFLLLFESAADASRYALAYHWALSELQPPLQARVGLHVGEVLLRRNPPEHVARGAKPIEVEGLAKPLAARIMSLAGPGQTLLSAAAREALSRGAPEGLIRLESHGYWRMKGLSEPVELFEVGETGAPFSPPPDGEKVYRVVRSEDLWLPARQIRHNLPAERDAFVGRRADLDDLQRRLEEGARLVSVLGIGGAGKTRLVTRYGWAWMGDWPGGVWFCDLAEARDQGGITAAVARGLDAPLGSEDPVAQLGHTLAGRGRCLVILDNFEQVARHAPETVGRWLDRAPSASFVVTTREVLGLRGEQALVLAPLDASEAEALFEARARAARREYVPDPASEGRLVELLDRLPLAIELAAARVRVMSPRQILERIGERFKLLSASGGRRDRQSTLRAALDWSWELLSDDERSALAQLSVFQGGFALEAAEAALSLASLWPADAVQALVDKSLVRRAGDDRLDLLVSVQEYAAEKLSDRAGAELRHGQWFAHFGADEVIEALDRRGGGVLRRALALDLDNLSAACRRAVARGDGEIAAAALRAAWAVMELRGPFSAAAALADEVMGLPDLDLKVRAATWMVAGQARHRQGRAGEANAHYEAALAVYRQIDDRAGEGKALGYLGILRRDQGQPGEAKASFEAALAIHRERNSRHREGVLLANLGSLAREQGQLEETRAFYEAALALHREAGDRRNEGLVLGNLGILHAEQGRPGEADAHYEAALSIHREGGDRRLEAAVLGSQGNLRVTQGRPAEALRCYEAALAIHRESGARRGEAVVLANLAYLRQTAGRLEEAAAHYEEALAICREVGDRRLEPLLLDSLTRLRAAGGGCAIRQL